MFKKFISYYRPYKFLIFIDLLAALIISCIDLIFPSLVSYSTNTLIPDDRLKLMFLLGGILLLFYFLRAGLSFVLSYWGHIAGTRIERDMRQDLFKKYQELDYRFFDDNKTGVLMANLTSHLRDIAEMAHHLPEDLFISFILFTGSFILLITINWKLTIIIFIIIILLSLFAFYRRQKMIKSFRQIRLYHGELNSQIESSLGGIRLTKAFNNEEYEIEKFKTANDTYEKSWNESYKQMGIFNSGTEFLTEITNLVILLYGGYLVANNQLTIIGLTTYFLRINLLIAPVKRLLQAMQQTQQGLSGFEKFYYIMNLTPSIVNKPGSYQPERINGQIEFINASFAYEKDDLSTHVLDKLNLKINAGESIALVGETGVGKSTISKLIPRFYDLDSGEIKIDGVDVKDYDLSFLRNSIGHVQQDVFIFWGTIKENILYGKPGASMEEVIEAAKKANINDFILTLDQGYNSMVGERGIKLSGGQKQRISLARLFLKNPPILILDEATSSLDNITEKHIQESLKILSEGRTTITIAHRLSTIKDLQDIIVLGRNGILERGNHQQLIQNNGYYAKLYLSNFD